MKGMEAITEVFKAHYEKIIAFVVLLCLLLSLLYLAIEIGSLQQMQKDFDKEIDLKPLHPAAIAMDVKPYEDAQEKYRQPPSVNVERWGERQVFLPEARIWCSFERCRMPILPDAKVCPFCKTEIKEDESRDSDHDGIPDTWEKKWGLDPYNAADAELDKDGDGFTNLEEFGADIKAGAVSDATDPKSTPGDYLVKLSLAKIDVVPFLLRFRGGMEMPGGALKFQVNHQKHGETPRTYFKKMGETVEGWTLTKYEKKTRKEPVPGIAVPQDRDVSELTLTKGDKAIVLVKDVDKQHDEYTVHFNFSVDKSTFADKMGEPFQLKEKKYKLMQVDIPGLESVLIQRLEDGKTFTVRKKPAKEGT